MAYKIELEQFQGPLDLLLKLIQDQKLDISQVALARVTDQYLSYLDNCSDIGASELADFLVVATKLLVIKSKILLPEVADEEDDSAEDLEQQIKIYKEYLDASKKVEKIIAKENFLYVRDKIGLQLKPTFSPPKNISTGIIKDCFADILHRIDYVVNLPEQVMERVITLKEKISDIRENLKSLSQMNFKNVLSDVKSKADVVVCFMAVLELVKSEEVAVIQKGVLDEIIIQRTESR